MTFHQTFLLYQYTASRENVRVAECPSPSRFPFYAGSRNHSPKFTLTLLKRKQTGLVPELLSSSFPFFSAHSQALNAIKQIYAINGIAPGMACGPRWRSRCIMDLFENATLEKELYKQNQYGSAEDCSSFCSIIFQHPEKGIARYSVEGNN